MARTAQDAPSGEPDAGPAEDLSGDDDLLNHVLVNTIAQSNSKGIGVHPQTVGYTGPIVACDEVLDILQKHVIERGDIQGASKQFLQWSVLKAHLDTRQTGTQKGRFIKHLQRYLMIYAPTSRVEIYKTDRYKEVSLHDELGVYAVKNLEEGTILDELQGSVVKFPKSWEADLERGRTRDLNDDEEHSEDEDEDDSGMEQEDGGRNRKRKPSVPQRRSERTGRRDFSVLRSALKGCLQLFLGPARFLNHDCANNVELYRKGSYVTFKVVRPIKIGQELTTYYGPDYFGRGNRECLCLTCEIRGSGYYKENPSKKTKAEAAKRAEVAKRSESKSGSKAGTSRRQGNSDDEAVDTPASTPRKSRQATVSVVDSPAAGSVASDPPDSDDDEPRRQPTRAARLKSRPLQWGVRQRGHLQVQRAVEDLNLNDDSDSDGPEDGVDAGRCLTCATKTKSLWVHKQEFLLCPRCSRHAMIFLMPWPAHRRADVREYPPKHLIPRNFFPPKVSDHMLPTFLPRPKPPLAQRVELAHQAATAKAAALLRATSSEIPDTKEHRHARRRTDEAHRDDFNYDQAALEAWEMEVARREAQLAKEHARERAKRQRAETKRKLDEGKEKGVGLWARYIQETLEEREAREKKKYQFVTGTRSGRKIRDASADEQEIERLAREALLRERNREKAQSEKQREWREREKERKRQQEGDENEDDNEEEEEEEEEVEEEEEEEEEVIEQFIAPPAPTDSAFEVPLAPSRPTPLPAQKGLTTKVQNAGGDEGDGDEDDENAQLANLADDLLGTAENPIHLMSDDDGPIVARSRFFVVEQRSPVKQELQPANTSRIANGARGGSKQPTRRSSHGQTPSVTPANSREGASTSSKNPTARQSSSTRAPTLTPRSKQFSPINIAEESDVDDRVRVLPKRDRNMGELQRFDKSKFSSGTPGSAAQSRASGLAPNGRGSATKPIEYFDDSDDGDAWRRRRLQPSEDGSPGKPVQIMSSGDEAPPRKKARPTRVPTDVAALSPMTRQERPEPTEAPKLPRSYPPGTPNTQKRLNAARQRERGQNGFTASPAGAGRVSAPGPRHRDQSRVAAVTAAVAAVVSRTPRAESSAAGPWRSRPTMSEDEASPRDGASGEDDHEARSAESVEREVGTAASSNRPAAIRQPTAAGSSKQAAKRKQPNVDPLVKKKPNVEPAKKKATVEPATKKKPKARSFFTVPQEEITLPRTPHVVGPDHRYGPFTNRPSGFP